MKKLILAIAAIAGLSTPMMAQAQHWDHGDRHYDHRYDNRYDGYRQYDRGYQTYSNDGRYYDYDRREWRYVDRNDRYRDDRYRRCDNGTTGTVIGAIAGGLLGNGLAGRHDRGVGTVLGAGGGALAGRALTRDCR